MAKVMLLFFPFAIFSGALSCSRSSPFELKSGIYTVRSGLLNQDGKFRELRCTGSFQFEVTQGQNTIELQTKGSTDCAAASPASFVDRLGGDCQLQPIILNKAEDDVSYAASGASLTCNMNSPTEVKISLQAVSDSALRLTRRGSADNIQSEILFERTANEL